MSLISDRKSHAAETESSFVLFTENCCYPVPQLTLLANFRYERNSERLVFVDHIKGNFITTKYFTSKRFWMINLLMVNPRIKMSSFVRKIDSIEIFIDTDTEKGKWKEKYDILTSACTLDVHSWFFPF